MMQELVEARACDGRDASLVSTASDTADSLQRLQLVFARYLKAQSHKRALIWQKK